MTSYTHCLLGITTCHCFTSFIAGSQSNRLQLRPILPKKQRNLSSRCTATLRKKKNKKKSLQVTYRKQGQNHKGLTLSFSNTVTTEPSEEGRRHVHISHKFRIPPDISVRKVSFLNPYIMDN